jgi:histidine triad (HIT) family protein
MTCLFCRLTVGDVPAGTIDEDESLVVLHDINPQAPVHVLVVPRRHMTTLNDIQPDDELLPGAMLRRAAAVAAELESAQRGYGTVFNGNREAGQSVFHIHLPVLGGRPLHWPPG